MLIRLYALRGRRNVSKTQLATDCGSADVRSRSATKAGGGAAVASNSLFRVIRLYLELIRFSHTLFALPFALLGAAMAWAETPFQWRHLAGILLCMVFARSAAMAFNRWADARFDALNPRTAGRHLPRGIVSPASVAVFTAVSSLGFIASTLLFLPNPWPVSAAVPVLLFLLGYSFAKRFTSASHIWLGAALALSPLAAYVAIVGDFALPPILLSSAVVFWVTGFDIIYACQDTDFDRRFGLRSIPARWGVSGALRASALSHILFLGVLAALACTYAPFGLVYRGGLIVVGLVLAYEHLLVRPDDLSRLNQAFFTANAVISIGLFLIGTADIFWL